MFDNAQPQNQVLDIRTTKKPYTSPELKECGNMEELTRGTGVILTDVAVQGSLTVTLAVL